MKINVSASKGKSVTDRVAKMTLVATTDDDAETLAVIFKTLSGLEGDGKYIAVIDPAQPGKIGRWSLAEGSGV